MTSTDNAVVNVPLAKRGNIDAQIAKYLKAARAKAEADGKRLRAEKREQMALVKELVAAVSDERMAALGKPHGLTAKQTRRKFIEAAFINPQRVITSMRAELARA